MMKKQVLKKIVAAIYMMIATVFIIAAGLILATIEIDNLGTTLVVGLVFVAGIILRIFGEMFFKD